jgi:phenylalanyl-tRNA synthetase beta chain
LPEERNLLNAALYRDRRGRRWGQVDSQDFYDGKALVNAVADSFGLVLDYRRLEHPLFLTGRAAGVIGVGAGSLVGAVGEIQPDVLSEFDIEKSTIVVVFDLDRLGELPTEERRYEPLPRFPAVQQDLAIVVDQSITSAEVEQVILHAGQPLLESIELFDLFQGESIGWGRRSLAYHLNYRVADRTLTDEEVASRHQAIIKALSDRLGATLRA